MKTISKILLIALLLTSAFFFSCSKEKKPEQVSSSDFVFRENEDGSVTVTGYIGLEKDIVIPSEIDGKAVTALGENSFRKMKDLISVVIPDSVQVIDCAFIECTSLESVSIGSGVITMNGAFKGCTALKTVSGGEKTEMMDEAFEGCTSLTSANIYSKTVSCISAYKDCTSLKSALIENGVTSLDGVFRNCTSLESVTLPESVKQAPAAFENCTSLKTIDGVIAFTELDKTFKNCMSIENIVLSGTVTVMKNAFEGCVKLESVTNLPTEVTSYAGSFYGCSSINEIVIPKMPDEEAESYDIMSDLVGCVTVKKITVLSNFMIRGEFCKTFSGCSQLSELVLPEEMLKTFLRVDYSYTDKLYTGEMSELTKAIKECKKANSVRITDDYGFIDGVSYTRVYGGDINVFDPEEIKGQYSVIGFEQFTKTSYWCGYPEGTNRKTQTVGIERVYSFFLKVTGKNDGTLPSEIIINGMKCAVKENASR